MQFWTEFDEPRHPCEGCPLWDDAQCDSDLGSCPAKEVDNMQLKIRVKTNDNENVEEWWPVEQVLEGAALSATVASIRGSMEILAAAARAHGETIAEHGREFSANHGLMYSLSGRIDNLAKRIERLEQMLAKNGTTEAIELRSQLIREVNGRYIGEEPDPNGARWRDIAQREVAQHGSVTPEEARETNEPHKDAIIKSVAAERGWYEPKHCPRCNGLMPPGRDLCRECESDLAEEQATLCAGWDEVDEVDWQAGVIEEEGL